MTAQNFGEACPHMKRLEVDPEFWTKRHVDAGWLAKPAGRSGRRRSASPGWEDSTKPARDRRAPLTVQPKRMVSPIPAKGQTLLDWIFNDEVRDSNLAAVGDGADATSDHTIHPDRRHLDGTWSQASPMQGNTSTGDAMAQIPSDRISSVNPSSSRYMPETSGTASSINWESPSPLYPPVQSRSTSGGGLLPVVKADPDAPRQEARVVIKEEEDPSPPPPPPPGNGGETR
ncbi:hypothetical protein BCR34DRAFT_608382 [Clohesyomyces aquaticus]|uniref:Uncharacterized protein n=1 Tax=Clohesyomyces aquaticus TaxID=1231657 RepID=A0A1Y1Y7S2_9PLEO|nr:hypothetical protein BCR34DRAFT_608382 [Clohesyomyces aquaticus]